MISFKEDLPCYSCFSSKCISAYSLCGAYERFSSACMYVITSLSFSILLYAVSLWNDLQFIWAAGRKQRKNRRRVFGLKAKPESRSKEGNHFRKIILVRGIDTSY